MPRCVVLANSSLMVCLDSYCQVRDVYFPHIGLDNHVMGQPHRLGVLTNGRFSWLGSDWQISQSYQNQSLICDSQAVQPNLAVKLQMTDTVIADLPVFLRQVVWHNTSHQPQIGKIFFHQVFFIYEGTKRNTAFFDPTNQALIHYKGRRVFLAGGSGNQGMPITEYSVGAYQEKNLEGTYLDAQDGVLSQNAVEHGSVDSVFALPVQVKPGETQTFYYWCVAGKSLTSVSEVQREVLRQTPATLISQTKLSWQNRLAPIQSKLSNLTPEWQTMAQTAVLMLLSHTDCDGAIIASSDSDTLQYGKDDYSYFWPRDGMYVCSSLIKAGYLDLAKKYLLFCQKILHPDGYLHHRYRSDGSLGSTWHSSVAQTEWLSDKLLQLPIQEDETAGVLITLHQYYQATQDIGLVRVLAQTLIEPICQFLLNFRQKANNLPLPSYDIWEEQSCVSTYTASAVYAGLRSGQELCTLLHWSAKARLLQTAADKMHQGIVAKLYSPSKQRFLRAIKKTEAGEAEQDDTIDSSTVFGLWYFGVLDQTDELFKQTLSQATAQLCTDPSGIGWTRYQSDAYFRRGDKSNYWVITTMWECLRRLHQSDVSSQDVEYVKNALRFIASHQTSTGLLGEQIDPDTGEMLSATPLVWSHAAVLEVLLLLNKVLDQIAF